MEKNGEPEMAHHREYIALTFVKARICIFSAHQQEYIKFP